MERRRDLITNNDSNIDRNKENIKTFYENQMNYKNN